MYTVEDSESFYFIYFYCQYLIAQRFLNVSFNQNNKKWLLRIRNGFLNLEGPEVYQNSLPDSFTFNARISPIINTSLCGLP